MMRKSIAAAVSVVVGVFASVSTASGAPGDEYLAPLGCSDDAVKVFCEQNRRKFVTEYPQAIRGDYQSQRNVAFCLFTGCDGAITENKITACAWRMIIITGGSMKIDRSDTANMQLCRNQLSSDELIAASGQAKTLIGKVKR